MCYQRQAVESTLAVLRLWHMSRRKVCPLHLSNACAIANTTDTCAIADPTDACAAADSCAANTTTLSSWATDGFLLQHALQWQLPAQQRCVLLCRL